MKTLSKWYPVILCIIGVITVLTTVVVKCVGQEPVHKCNTVYKFVFYPLNKTTPDTVYAVGYTPDSTVVKLTATK